MDNHNKTKLVLLPGFDGTGLLFNKFVDNCPSDFVTEIIQLPSDGDQTYDALYDRIKSQLPKQIKYLLLGESFSGPLSIKIAANDSNNIQGLILVSTFVVDCWLRSSSILAFDESAYSLCGYLFM